MPSRRQSSEIFSSPAVLPARCGSSLPPNIAGGSARRMSFSTCPAGTLPGPAFCFIFAAIRARISVSHACGSMPFIFAVTMRLYIAAARRPPRSDPQNSQDFRPRAMPRKPRSAALLERHTRSSSRNSVKLAHRFSDVVERLGQVVTARQFGELFAHVDLKVLDQRPAQRLPHLKTLLGSPSIDRALDLEQRIGPPYDLDRDRRERDLLLAGGSGQPIPERPHGTVPAPG